MLSETIQLTDNPAQMLAVNMKGQRRDTATFPGILSLILPATGQTSLGNEKLSIVISYIKNCIPCYYTI